jgi:hypothetical protein
MVYVKSRVPKFNVGNQMNDWTILDPIGSKDKHGQWKILVRCKCGNEKIVTEYSVWSGKSVSCSTCGHKRRAAGDYRKRDESGDLNSSWTHYLDGYIRSANKRGFEFSLLPEKFKELCRLPCHYCDNPPNNNRNFGGGRILTNVNGIDRKNSSEGYTNENCVSCCKICNKMKSTLTTEEFIAHVERIYKKVCD